MRWALMGLALIMGGASCAPLEPSNSVVATSQRGGVDILRSADGSVALVDRSGKGAVLCVWSLYVTAQELGRRCFAGQDKALQAELEISIKKTEAFILKNSSSHPKPADVAARKASIVREVKNQPLCTGEEVQLYRALQNQGVEALRSSTNEMLSTPREPVVNPCV